MADNLFTIVWTAPRVVLRDPLYYTRLWQACKQQTHIKSRTWIWALSAFLRDVDIYHLQIWDSETGRPFKYPDLNLVFPDEACDGRWFRFFLASDSFGLQPRGKCSDILKLTILDLFARCTNAQFAAFAHQFSNSQAQDVRSREETSLNPSVFPGLYYEPQYDVFGQVKTPTLRNTTEE